MFVLIRVVRVVRCKKSYSLVYSSPAGGALACNVKLE
jgi:hypothetical protein